MNNSHEDQQPHTYRPQPTHRAELEDCLADRWVTDLAAICGEEGSKVSVASIAEFPNRHPDKLGSSVYKNILNNSSYRCLTKPREWQKTFFRVQVRNLRAGATLNLDNLKAAAKHTASNQLSTAINGGEYVYVDLLDGGYLRNTTEPAPSSNRTASVGSTLPLIGLIASTFTDHSSSETDSPPLPSMALALLASKGQQPKDRKEMEERYANRWVFIIAEICQKTQGSKVSAASTAGYPELCPGKFHKLVYQEILKCSGDALYHRTVRQKTMFEVNVREAAEGSDLTLAEIEALARETATRLVKACRDKVKFVPVKLFDKDIGLTFKPASSSLHPPSIASGQGTLSDGVTTMHTEMTEMGSSGREVKTSSQQPGSNAEYFYSGPSRVNVSGASRWQSNQQPSDPDMQSPPAQPYACGTPDPGTPRRDFDLETRVLPAFFGLGDPLFDVHRGAGTHETQGVVGGPDHNLGVYRRRESPSASLDLRRSESPSSSSPYGGSNYTRSGGSYTPSNSQFSLGGSPEVRSVRHPGSGGHSV
jgi:hypothetical protein